MTRHGLTRHGLRFQKLGLRDALFCKRLASMPSVRAVSREPDPPTWRKHLAWLLSWVYKRDRRAWVIEATGPLRKIGLVRARSYGRRCVLSVAVLPDYRGQGIGTDAIRFVCEWAVASGWGIPTAYIREDNEPSRRAFAAAGFVDCPLTTMDGVWRMMQYVKPPRT